VSDLQFVFTDAAFTIFNAADVINATGPASSNLGIYFLSSDTEILTFSFLEQTGSATIDTTNYTVDIEVEIGADRTNLAPDITLSEGATISPNSGVAQDFSNPVTYTVTAEDGATIQDWIVTVAQVPLGLEEEFARIRIYPNPTTNRVNISGIEEAYSIQLLNLLGRTIYSGSNEPSINVSGLSDGIYFLKMATRKGNTLVWKLIKN